jgi:hypothetical protein
MRAAANDRIAKLIRMLFSSDKTGEVVAAASAIKRVLAAEGSDFHALADTLCRHQPPRREEPPRQPRPPPREDDWHGMACECLPRASRNSSTTWSDGRRFAHRPKNSRRGS